LSSVFMMDEAAQVLILRSTFQADSAMSFWSLRYSRQSRAQPEMPPPSQGSL
jgi:hypothetical protein